MLLREYYEIPLSERIISEARDINKKLLVPGTLQRAGVFNENKRRYSVPLLQREFKRYQSLVDDNRALGELDHSETSVVNLQNTSHVIREQRWDGNDIRGTLEILNTPMGTITRSLISSGVKLGISSRGVGSLATIESNDGGDMADVQDDYILVCYDIVSNPSTDGAFLGESVADLLKDKRYRKNYTNINNLINDIITYIF